MKMKIEMRIECEKCGNETMYLVPVSYHYSDGCYNILATTGLAPKCKKCESSDMETKSARYIVERFVDGQMRFDAVCGADDIGTLLTSAPDALLPSGQTSRRLRLFKLFEVDYDVQTRVVITSKK